MNTEAVAKNIRRLVKSKGLSMRRFGREIGFSERAVHYWVSGKGIPGGYALYCISRYFGVTMEEIMEGVEDEW